MLNAHLYPVFAEREIAEITTGDIQEFLNARTHLAEKTLKELITFLREVFADAIEDNYMKKNPTISRKLVIPSHKKAERNALSKDQILDILDQAGKLDGYDKRLICLLLLTGMRRGEVLGLRWEDLDIEDGLIHVRRNVTFPQNQPHIGTPKTKKGERSIPLEPVLWELLQPAQKEGFIIGGDKPITHMVFRRSWERISKKVNLYGASPHIFRHSYLTLANNAGVDPKTLQAIGGHADITTTMNTYVHQQLEQIRGAGDKIGAHLFTA